MKRKSILLITVLSLIFTLVGCTSNPVNNSTTKNGENETYTLPDIKGLTYIEAIAKVSGKVKFEVTEIPTNTEYPDLVMGYSSKNVGDVVNKGDTVRINVSKKPLNSYSYDSKVNYVSEICKLTGPTSVNKDVLLSAGIYGTDLGFPVERGNETIFLFGDTFSQDKMKGMWFSNFVARTTDKNLDDDLVFDSVVTTSSGQCMPFAQGLHNAGQIENTGTEVTKIPTGGITIGNNTYIFYMSIRYWGTAGSWLVSYNQCIKTTNLGTYVNVESLRWNEDEAPNFGQIYPFKDPNSEYIYLYGIEGGRNGGMVVARVTEENFENRSEYEYEVGSNVWLKGDAGLEALKNNPYYLIEPTVSEMTITYNEYLGKYMIIFYRNSKLIMLTANNAYSKFENPITLTTATEYPGIYGGLTCQSLLKDGGKTFYMVVSCWEVYNTFWVKVVLN